MFYVIMLEQDIIKKYQVNKNEFFLKPKLKLEVGGDNRYKMEVIQNYAVYTNKVVGCQLLELYYLVFENSYLEVKNT